MRILSGCAPLREAQTAQNNAELAALLAGCGYDAGALQAGLGLQAAAQAAFTAVELNRIRGIIVKNKERNHFEIMGSGQGVYWPDLDEDLSAIGMLNGVPARQPASTVHRANATA